MEKTFSGLEYAGDQRGRLQGFFKDYDEDIGDRDIPAALGQFQRYEPDAGGTSYGDPYKGLFGNYWQRNLQTNQREPAYKQPSDGGPGSGGDPAEKEFKQHLDSYKAITGKVGRMNPVLAMMMGQMGSQFFSDPSNVQQLQGILTPMEQQIVQMNLQYIEGHFRGQTGGNDPMGIR